MEKVVAERKTVVEEKVIFCVYGTLKIGYGNHRLLTEAKPLGKFITPASYTLFDGGFPVVERGGETAVHCELYETSNPDTIKRVFQLEGCDKQQDHPNSWYTYDKMSTPHGEAVMFVMNKDQSGRDRALPGGVWGR